MLRDPSANDAPSWLDYSSAGYHGSVQGLAKLRSHLPQGTGPEKNIYTSLETVVLDGYAIIVKEFYRRLDVVMQDTKRKVPGEWQKHANSGVVKTVKSKLFDDIQAFNAVSVSVQHLVTCSDCLTAAKVITGGPKAQDQTFLGMVAKSLSSFRALRQYTFTIEALTKIIDIFPNMEKDKKKSDWEALPPPELALGSFCAAAALFTLCCLLTFTVDVRLRSTLLFSC